MRTQAKPDPLGLKSLLTVEIRNGHDFGHKAKISRARMALGSMCTFCKLWPFRQQKSDNMSSIFCFSAHQLNSGAIFPKGFLCNPLWLEELSLRMSQHLITHFLKAKCQQLIGLSL